MKIFAYCAYSFKESTAKASGVEPATCPPMDSQGFNTLWLAGKDLIYFDFHGEPGGDIWYEQYRRQGDLLPTRTVALTAIQLSEAALTDSVVFVLSCHLADKGSPMLEALLDAGAAYVIGGDGKNWASTGPTLFGAAQLGYLFRIALTLGLDPLPALDHAKRALENWVSLNREPTEKQLMAAADTLEFKAYTV